MRITKTSLPLHDMICQTASQLHVDYLEFAGYIPGDGYCIPPRMRLSMPRHELETMSLDSIRDRVCDEDRFVLGLSSLIVSNDQYFHLPQIDFSCKISNENEERVYDTLHGLDMHSGYVLESGESYHFHGIDLMPRKFWADFMDRLQEYTVVDEAWLNESAQQRLFSILRLSANSIKRITPKVIARIEDDQMPLFPKNGRIREDQVEIPFKDYPM